MGNVLEVEYEKVFEDYYVMRIKQLNKEILVPNEFIDEILKVRCSYGYSYYSEDRKELTIGYGHKDDALLIRSIDVLNEILKVIEQLNEKYKDFYGYYPKYGSEYYYIKEGYSYYNNDGLFYIEEKKFKRDSLDIKNYANFNCFTSKKEAETAIEKLKETLRNIRKEKFNGGKEND